MSCACPVLSWHKNSKFVLLCPGIDKDI